MLSEIKEQKYLAPLIGSSSSARRDWEVFLCPWNDQTFCD